MACPPNPPAPGNIVVNNSQIDLSWTDNSQIENGYKVDRSLDGGASYQPLVSAGGQYPELQRQQRGLWDEQLPRIRL